MAWTPGPQQLTSVAVGGNTINGDLIENFSVETEGSSYDSAKGIPVERGFVTKTVTFDNLDYSKVTALEGLMTGKAEQALTITYADSASQAFTGNDGIVRVLPLVNMVPDTCKFYFNASGTGSLTDAFDALTSNFTDAGTVIGEPSFEFSFPYDGVDGCGRPFFGDLVRADINFQITVREAPGIDTDAYAGLGTFGANVDAAFAMPNGNYLGFVDMYMYFYYGPEDATGVRTIDVHLRGVADKWSTMIGYTDGASLTALTDAWGVETNSVDPGNTFAGCNVEIVGTDNTEPSKLTWA